MKQADYDRAAKLFAGGMTDRQWAEGMVQWHGGEAGDWLKQYLDHGRMVQEKTDTATLLAKVEAYAVPKRLVRLLDDCHAYGKKHGTTPSIGFELLEDGLTAKAVLLTQRAKRTRKTTTTDGENKGRKSAWLAYQEGQEGADKFEIQKTGKRGIYVDMTDSNNPREISRKEGGLCGYLRKTYPDSDASKILYKFGYDRLG